MRVGSLFAGYEGIGLGVEQVFPDAELAWVSEFDKAPSKILATRYPDVPNYGDVTKVDWANIEPVDIITGGSPCQDLSHAGKRAGMKAGTRSGLWASMCDAIDIIRPQLVLWENVRGALSAEATAGDVESCEFCVGDDGRPSLRALGRVLGDLAELGYDAAWCGLRAADVGAPHGRYRIFVLAWPAADSDDDGRREQLARRSGATVAGTVDAAGAAGVVWGSREWRELTLLKTPTSQLGINGGSQHPDKRKEGGHGPTLADEVEHLLPTPVVNDMGRAYTPETWDEWTARLKASHGNGNGHGASLSIEALRMLPTPTTTQRGPDANIDTREGARDNLHNAIEDFGQYGPAIERWEALTRPAPPPTEPTGKGGAQRLSPRFVEWMMGLPPGWVTDVDISRNEQLKALGNGVVPQQCAAALRYLLAIKEST